MWNQLETDTQRLIRRKEFLTRRQPQNFEPIKYFFSLEEAIKRINVEELAAIDSVSV